VPRLSDSPKCPDTQQAPIRISRQAPAPAHALPAKPRWTATYSKINHRTYAGRVVLAALKMAEQLR
jgi:hypothetical protein